MGPMRFRLCALAWAALIIVQVAGFQKSGEYCAINREMYPPGAQIYDAKIRTITFVPSQKSFQVPEQVLSQSQYFRIKMKKTDGVIEINETEKGFNADCEESFSVIIGMLREGAAYITKDIAENIRNAALFYKLGDGVIQMFEYVANLPETDITVPIIQEKTKQITKLQIYANELNKKIEGLTEMNRIGETEQGKLEHEIHMLKTTAAKIDLQKNALEIEIGPLRQKCDELELEKVKVAALKKQIEGLLVQNMLNFDVTKAEAILAQGGKCTLIQITGSIKLASVHNITKFNFRLEMPETKILQITGFQISLPLGFFIDKIEVENGIISKQLDFVRFSQQKVYLLNREPLIGNTDYQFRVYFGKGNKDSETTTAKKTLAKNTQTTNAASSKTKKWTLFKPKTRTIFNDVTVIPIEGNIGYENTLISEIVFNQNETKEPTAKIEEPTQKMEDPIEETATGEASEQLVETATG